MRKATFSILQRARQAVALCILMTLSIVHAKAQCPNLTVFCQDLHTTFMPNACMVEVWAKDFVSKINDGSESLDSFEISFAKDSVVMNRIFDSRFGDSYEVQIYITDPRCGVQSSCIVTLDINDNTGDCATPECPTPVNPWCGYSVVTCSAATMDDHIATIIDVRPNSRAPRGDNWSDPLTAGADQVEFIRPDAWKLGQIGMVYGIALNPLQGDIYLAASDIYARDFKEFVSVGFPPPSCSGPAGPGGIYKSSFDTDASNITATPIIFTDTLNYRDEATVIGTNIISNSGNTRECQVVTIEQLQARARTGNGIGNIAFDWKSNHLVASNLQDGKIYSINLATNTVSDVLDPWNAYNPATWPAQVDSLNRIWAVQTYTCDNVTRVFFARESLDPRPVDNETGSNRAKQVWSARLGIDGRFLDSDTQIRRELTVEIGRQRKFTDMAFNFTCDRMLLAERGDDHKSRVFEYRRLESPDADGNRWAFNKRVHVGIFDDDAPNQPDGIIRGSSASGGVSYGSIERNGYIDAACDSLIWATMNCGDVVADPGRCDVYGIQGVSAAGNEVETNGETDIFVDFNAEFTNDPLNFKSNIGEVEVFNCCCPTQLNRIRLDDFRAIAGTVGTVTGSSLRSVEVSINSSAMTMSAMTDGAGRFNFSDLDKSYDYMLTSGMDDEAITGISTADLILMQRHILGLARFDQPYQYIAADINKSGHISATDLVELRKILLAKQDQFNDNKVWNFLPQLPSIDKLESSVSYEEYFMVNDLTDAVTDISFTGVKTGDINNDYGVAKSRSAETVELLYRKNGSRIEFFIDGQATMSGIQFALKGIGPDAQIIAGAMGITEQHAHHYNGELLISWNDLQAITLTPELPLFSIEGSVADLALGGIITSEIYDSELNIKGLQLKESILNQVVAEDLAIYPNPTVGSFDVTFDLPETQDYTLQIISRDGKMVYNMDKKALGGRQNVSISQQEMSSVEPGVYLVRLITGHQITTKKLILIK